MKIKGEKWWDGNNSKGKGLRMRKWKKGTKSECTLYRVKKQATGNRKGLQSESKELKGEMKSNAKNNR